MAGSGGVSVTCHVLLVTVLVFPAASWAWTPKLCDPSASELYAFGLAQSENAPPSSRQRNVTPDSESVNEKWAVLWIVIGEGFDCNAGAGGGVTSILQPKVVGALSSPPALRALTAKLCSPSPRDE